MTTTIIQRRRLARDRDGPKIDLTTFLDGKGILSIDTLGLQIGLHLSGAEVGRLAEIFSESGLAAIKCEVAAIAVKEMAESDQVTV